MKSILILLALMSVSVTSNEKWSWGESEHHPTRTGKSPQTTLVFSDNTDQSKDILKSILEPAPEKTEIRAASTRQARKIDVPKPKVSDAAYSQGDTHTSSTQGDGHVSHAQGDGQSEARFSKFKKGLCKYGIGINCPKGYDYIEVEQPYEEVQGYGAEYGYGGAQGGGYGGVGGYGAGYETAGIAQYGGGGGAISPHQVLQVQPVALQAVGAPIAAVPLGPGGSYGGGAGDIYRGGVGGGLNHGGAIASGGHSGALIGGGHGGGVGGGYGGVVNQGYGGGHGVVNQGYGVSQGGFGGGAVGPAFSGGHGGVVSQGYSAPAATYGAPAATYGAPPAPEYISPPGHGLTQVEYAGSVYEEPFAELELQEEIKPQVVNHYHTHTHIHQGQGSGSYAKDDSPYSGSHVSETINNSPPKRHTSVSDFGNSFSSREDCECVPNYFCPSSDVIGRHSDTPRLDARNKPTDILSTAPDTKTSSSTKSQIRENPPKTKSKREIRSTFKVINEKESMGRQAHGTSRIRNTRQSQEKKCSRGEVCCKNQGFKSRELSYSCGKKNAAGVLGRVKSSVIRETGDTQFGEYPWQAAILKREAGEVIYVCGGALVNDRHIVTAAHCVNTMNPSELKVRLGEWDVNRKSEFYDHIEVTVKKIVIHPTFYSGTLVNDIAIIILDEDVQFKKYPHINPICLPNPKSDFTNKHCHVTGWGKDAFGSDGAFQYILKEVEVPVWGHGSCEKSLRETRLGRTYELDSGMLCAGGEEGKDACKGDGGGPLVCPGADGSMELGGIVSWGIGCGERGIPGVYVNIPYYMEWITKVLQS